MHRKPLITKILLGTIGLMALAPMAHAQAISRLFGLDLYNIIAVMLATLSQWALSITSLFVTITGILFNTSIILTLHITDFVNNTTGVYLVWQTIRDISGMFIIFLLLYASFKLILGLDSGGINSVGNLIKNIVIAGILINFSFFITSLLIDASNIVSMTLYNDIVSAKSTGGYQSISDMVSSATNSSNPDGGMSGIFMNLLMPQNVYSPSSAKLSNVSNGVSQSLTILIQGVVGVVIMITVGLSFFLASIAFVIRFAYLIVLLAFSPIWFASMILPGMVKEYSTKFSEKLQNQLIFMPVYLLLLYVAIRILSTSKIFANPTTNILTGSGISRNLIILFINDFFIIFMLNLPLLVALSMSGSLGKLTKKFGADAIWKSVGASAGRRTAGRAAYAINRSDTMGRITASMPTVGGALSKGLSNVSSAGWGQGKKGSYEEALKAKKKAQDEMHKKVGDSVRREDFAEGKEGDADYLKAKTERQAKYRQNVAWPEWSKSKGLGGKAGSVLGFMLDNRANMESQSELGKKAAKEDTKRAADAAAIKLRQRSTAIDNVRYNGADMQKRTNDKHDNNMDNMDKNAKPLIEEDKSIQAELVSLQEKIRAESGINNLGKAMGRPSTTATEEKKVVDLQNRSAEVATALKNLNEQKAEAVRKHRLNIETLQKTYQDRARLLEKQKAGFNEIKIKGDKIKSEERDDKILGKIKGLEEKMESNKDKGSGSAPSTPKQPETH